MQSSTAAKSTLGTLTSICVMTTSVDTQIVSRITQAVHAIQRTAGFQDWCTAEAVQPADHVIINNTFIFREAGTKKAAVYLTARFTTATKLGGLIVVSPDRAQNA